MDTTALIELMRDRSLSYRFLSRAYRTAPDAAFVATIESTCNADPSCLAGFLAYLKAEGPEQTVIDVAADYNRLFLGMGAHPVAPFESVYTSEEGLLMQEARDGVLAAYRKAGFAVPSDFDLPEDHAALELEFLAILAEGCAEALEKGASERAKSLFEQQASFLTEHVARWMPAFAADAKKQARTPFFQEIADMTAEWVREDSANLQEVEKSGAFA